MIVLKTGNFKGGINCKATQRRKKNDEEKKDGMGCNAAFSVAKKKAISFIIMRWQSTTSCGVITWMVNLLSRGKADFFNSTDSFLNIF